MLVHAEGVTHHDPSKALQGFTLFSHLFADAVYLIDMDGNVAHEWKTSGGNSHFTYLRPNGNLFVCETMEGGPALVSGKSGLMREYDWDGNIVWEHRDDHQHHDARRLANGNCVYIAWKRLSEEEAGRVKGGVTGTEHADGIYGEAIREVDPNGAVVFEWDNTDPAFMEKYPIEPLATRDEYGHANTVAETPAGNYIVSFRTLNLLIVIDRETGEVIWEHHDPALGGQHDCQFLENGNVLVFANGHHVPGGQPHFSQVWEIDPGSKEIVWKYAAEQNPLNFWSPHISGCQRLPNGNTLICEGGKGCLFEVTHDGEVVWEYVAPRYTRHPSGIRINWIFRAKRYTADSPEIRNRV